MNSDTTYIHIKGTYHIARWLLAGVGGCVLASLLALVMASLITPKDMEKQIYKLLNVNFIDVTHPKPAPEKEHIKKPESENKTKQEPKQLPNLAPAIQPSPVPHSLQSLSIPRPTLSLNIPTTDFSALATYTPNVGEPTFDIELYPLIKTDPIYPKRAKRRNITGWVNISFTINTQGLVENIQVISAEPEGIFEKSAIRAVQKWRFKPQLVDGKATARPVVQTLSFDL